MTLNYKRSIHRTGNRIVQWLSFILIFLTINAAQAQIQKGSDIDGEAAGDQSGYSVSMPDSNTLAIGGSFNDGSHVQVYKWNGSVWQQKGLDIDGEVKDDGSAWSISMPDSNTLAIGAPLNNGNGNNAGYVRIYSWNGSSWQQKGLGIDGEAAGDRSGRSVSMPDSNSIAIGAPYNNGNGRDAGHVRIYNWKDSTWQQKGTDIDGRAAGDQSGYSVNMPDSNTLAIGAPFNDGNGNNAGHVRIYRWNGSVWVKKGSDIEGDTAGDIFGRSVSMSDSNTLAIGAPNNNSNGNQAGHVRVHRWSGSEWVQKGSDIEGEAAGDLSGNSISMPDSNTVAIGAFWNDGNGSNAGHVRVFNWNGIKWVQKGYDIDGKAATDWFGYSVSMPDINTLAIGAPYNDGNGTDAGHVRVYSFCSTTANISFTACDSFTSPSGKYSWTSSNTYTDTIHNAVGCDSVITLDLTIISIDTSITKNKDTLIANQSAATYQWLNCDSSYSVVSGATDQIFSPIKNGNYACEISLNGCVDTSFCYQVIVTGIVEELLQSGIKIYPNPVGDFLNIEIENLVQNTGIRIRNVNGQLVYESSNLRKGKNQIDFSNWSKGVYFVRLIGDDFDRAVKVVRE